MTRWAPLLLFACACATAQPLDRRVVGGSPDVVSIDEVPVHGYEVDVELHSGADIEGELLAAQRGALYVLVEGEAVIRLPAEDIEEISIQLHDTREVLLGIWTGIGTVSTLSHGRGLVISAPIWAAVGATLTAVEGSTGDEEVSASAMPSLAQFARFPQGLPPGFGARGDAAARGPDEPPIDEPDEPVVVPEGYGEPAPSGEPVPEPPSADPAEPAEPAPPP